MEVEVFEEVELHLAEFVRLGGEDLDVVFCVTDGEGDSTRCVVKTWQRIGEVDGTVGRWAIEAICAGGETTVSAGSGPLKRAIKSWVTKRDRETSH